MRLVLIKQYIELASLGNIISLLYMPYIRFDAIQHQMQNCHRNTSVSRLTVQDERLLCKQYYVFKSNAFKKEG